MKKTNILALNDIMARQYDVGSFGDSGSSLSEDWYFDPDLLIQSEDFYSSVVPSDNIWKKFELLPTPPRSPSRDSDDSPDSDDENCPPLPVAENDWLSTAIYFEKSAGLKSKLIQDCMWSGSDEEQARSTRNRKYSLSEVTMAATSVASVDPTAITVVPKQQNQVEHSYSLSGPEPPRIPSLPTPATTDDSESEEDVDVVTVDTRMPMKYSTRLISTQFKVRHDLKSVAAKLSSPSLKRPKCMSDQEFSMPASKKSRRFSMFSSQTSSDSEDYDGKRSIHNVMERQRRNDLKLSLHSLRDILPSLETNEKAPKVVILAHATKYVTDLKIEDHKLTTTLVDLKQRNKALRDRLDELREQIDASF